MNPWAIVGGFVAALLVVWLAYSEGREVGRAEMIEANVIAVQARDRKLEVLQDDHAVQRKEFQLKLTKAENQSNEKIRKLLSENTELKAWWESLVPPDAAAYAWGVQDNVHSSPVPR